MTERTIPAGARREFERQETAEFPLYFLTITHRVLSTPIRVVSDPANFSIDGDLFLGFDFEISLLSDNDGMPYANLSIQNIDRRIGEALLKMTDPARLQIDVIAGSEFNLSVSPRTASDPEYIYQAKHLYLTETRGDVLAISGRIVSWDYTQELYPGLRATMDRFPGLFR